MVAMNATAARKNLYQVIAEVNANSMPITITNSHGKNAVLVSEEDWNSIQETLYLYSVPGLVPSILEAKAESIEEGTIFKEDEEW